MIKRKARKFVRQYKLLSLTQQLERNWRVLVLWRRRKIESSFVQTLPGKAQIILPPHSVSETMQYSVRVGQGGEIKMISVVGSA